MRWLAPLIVTVGLLLPACGDGSSPSTPTPSCGNGILEPPEACDWGIANSDLPDAVCRLNCSLRRCGDGVADSFESCDHGSANADVPDTPCRTDCTVRRCGDGIQDTSEACDDGDENSARLPDRCRADCSLPTCGDGVRDSSEECDEGTANSDLTPNRCRTDCRLPWCGDDTLDHGEECDNGFLNDDAIPNRCRTDCRLPWCGDGVADGDRGELCDDGPNNALTPDAICRPDCRPKRCGDGVRDADEECDDGSANSAVTPGACRPDCTIPFCGDGVVDLPDGELCDDGTSNATDVPNACRPGCVLPACGDGLVDDRYGEGCDLGVQNSDAPDAHCRSDCLPGRCGDGILDTNELCDNGSANTNAPNGACRTDCTLRRCGDAIVDAGEACDAGFDNSSQPNAICRPDCTARHCGDGVVDDLTGELCDLGAANSTQPDASCRPDCRPRRCGDGIQDAGEECDLGAANRNGISSACRTDCMRNGAITLDVELMTLIADPIRPRLYALTDTDPVELRVYDADLLQEATRIPLTTRSWDLAMPPDGSVLIIGAWTNEPIQAFDPITLQQTYTIPVVASNHVEIAEDHSIYYSWSSRVNRLFLEAGASSTEYLSWASPYSNTVGLALSPDGQSLFVSECNTSGGSLHKYDIPSESPAGESWYDEGYGFWYPSCLVYVCPAGNHVYYGGAQFDAHNLRMMHGQFDDELLVEDSRERFVVGSNHILDVETMLVRRAWDPIRVRVAAFTHDDKRLWYYSPDTGQLHYTHLEDLVGSDPLGQREFTPRPISDYSFIALYYDPIRPMLYGLDFYQTAVVAIDANTLQPVAEIVGGLGPITAAFDPAGDHLYTTNGYTTALARFTLEPFAFDGFAPTGDTLDSAAVLSDHRVVVSQRGWHQGPKLVHGLDGGILSDWTLSPYYPGNAILKRIGDTDELFAFNGRDSSAVLPAESARIRVQSDQFQLLDQSGNIPGINATNYAVPSPDGSQFYYAFYVFDGLDTNQVNYVLPDWILSVSTDGRLFFSPVQAWDAQRSEPVGWLPEIGNLHATSPDGLWLYVYTHFGELKRVDLSQFSPLPQGSTCGNGIVEPGEECDDADSDAWDGCDGCRWKEFRISTFGEPPRDPRIHLLSTGAGLLCWKAERPTLGGYAAYCERLNSIGQATSTPVQSNSNPITEDSPWDVGVAGDGRYVVGYQMTVSGYSDTYIRRFDAMGVPQGTDVRVPVDTTYSHNFSSLTLGPTGAGIVGFTQGPDDVIPGAYSGVYGRRLSSTLSLSGGDFRINTETYGSQLRLVFASSSNGFVAVWRSHIDDHSGDVNLRGQRFTAQGYATGPEFQINTLPAGFHYGHRVVMASDGSFIVAWYLVPQSVSVPHLVLARRFAPDGTPLGNEFQANMVLVGGVGALDIGMQDDGRFVLLWTRSSDEPILGGAIMRWFDASGLPTGPSQIVNRAYGVYNPRLATLGDGRAMAVWTRIDEATNEMVVVGQRWDGTGAMLGQTPW